PVVIGTGDKGSGPIMARNSAAESKRFWTTTSRSRKGGGLLAQAARNQTQGVEERYARGTTYSSRRKAGLFASTLMAKTVGRPQTSLETFCVVRMAHFKQGPYQVLPSSPRNRS